MIAGKLMTWMAFPFRNGIYPYFLYLEGVLAQWCYPLALQPEQSGGLGSIASRALPLERHGKGSCTQCLPSEIPALGTLKTKTSPHLI